MQTKVIKVDPKCVENAKKDIKKAAEILISGGLVAFPTETVYGLGGDGTNPTAAKKIYEAKGRPSDNPLIIHIYDPSDAEKYTYTSDLYYKLAAKYMPGPLTVVLDAKESVPKETSGGLSTVAVRCPSHPVARALINNPAIILADEPSGNLDSQSAKELHELFFNLRDKTGQTFVIVTHNPQLAEMADKTFTMKDGVIV